MRAGISESTRPAAAKELDRPQIINNRPLAVSLPRPDEFLRLADGAFSHRETRLEGRRVRFDMAADKIWVNGRGPWRRIVLRAKDGHQAPIITNLALGAPHLACLMLARWRQENLFKYMEAH